MPNVYPVDLFEHIWAVDRLERLGISRYFQQEIEECMNYVNRFFFATFQTIFYLKMQHGKTQSLRVTIFFYLHNKYINPFYIGTLLKKESAGLGTLM